ncbi:SH3 domain-containing protein [Pleionea sediminis]|uniref:SH3 domain-containing protein n=1 Tax=Pleionea sediminis TaxID=2569479 RepID=UPI001185076A|nr:SH3 domain-containing protein [Pleionea sediminis]
MKKSLWPLLFALVLTTSSQHLIAKDTVKLEVIDPYLEMHTGPGNGYPVIYTVEQGESVEILTRRPDWYEIKSERGRKGWVKASQIARTLVPTGEPVDLPNVSFGDYLENSWRIGFSTGQFSSGALKGAQTYSFTTGYRVLSWLGVELESGKFYDAEVRGDYLGANLQFEPWSEWVVSPVFTIGTGEMNISAQPELIELPISNSSYTQFGLGGSYYLGRNFVVRAGFRDYTVSTEQDDERLKRWHIGFSAFF